MLATPLVATAQACGYWGKWKKPVIACFASRVETWPTDSPDAEINITEEGDTVLKNLNALGTPPLIDGVPPDLSYYGRGGIRLTITKGANVYTLLGTVEQKILYGIFYVGEGGEFSGDGQFGISKWSFTITAVESGAAPADAVGSTMEGWTIVKGKEFQNAHSVYVSTKGTGMFEGAMLSGTYTKNYTYFVLPTGQGFFFTYEVGSGKIILH